MFCFIMFLRKILRLSQDFAWDKRLAFGKQHLAKGIVITKLRLIP